MSSANRIHDLIQKYFEALASDAETAELQALLVADARAADAFAEAARLHANLQAHFRQQYKLDEIESLLDGTQAGVPSATTFRPTFLRTGSSRRRPFASKADSAFHRWKPLVAVLLLAALGTAFWATRNLQETQPRLVSGTITTNGHAATDISRDRAFEVPGPESAVIELPGGARLELLPSTRGMFRVDAIGTVLHLDSGGGRFSMPSEQATLRIATVLGSVSASGAEFSLDLMTSPPALFSPTERLQLPRIVVLVSQGAVTLEHAGVLTTIAAGEQYVFPHPI